MGIRIDGMLLRYCVVAEIERRWWMVSSVVEVVCLSKVDLAGDPEARKQQINRMTRHVRVSRTLSLD